MSNSFFPSLDGSFESSETWSRGVILILVASTFALLGLSAKDVLQSLMFWVLGDECRIDSRRMAQTGLATGSCSHPV